TARARAVAASFPGAEESTSYGRPAFKVRKRLFAWVSPDDAAKGALATYVDEAEKELLIDSNPELYFSTPHYAGIRSCSRASSALTARRCASGSRTRGSRGLRGSSPTPTWPARGRPPGRLSDRRAAPPTRSSTRRRARSRARSARAGVGCRAR